MFKDGWLNTAKKVASPNHSGKFAGNTVDTILLHYTATHTAKQAVNWFADKAAKVSAHFVIDRDGTIYQCVNIENIAWHAGVSTHPKDGKKGLNSRSIGIELVNKGYSNLAIEGYTDLGLDFKGYRYWQNYTNIQLKVITLLSKVLSSVYQIDNILGHYEVSINRKQDPGPLLPINYFRYLDNNVDFNEGVISSNFARIRTESEIVVTTEDVSSNRVYLTKSEIGHLLLPRNEIVTELFAGEKFRILGNRFNSFVSIHLYERDQGKYSGFCPNFALDFSNRG